MDESNESPGAQDDAVQLALRSARRPRSGLAALLAVEGRALGARLTALYIVPASGPAQLLASGGPDAGVLGPPGPALESAQPFLRARAQRPDCDDSVPSPWNGYGSVGCSTGPLSDGTGVLLVGSPRPVDEAGVRRLSGPALLLAATLLSGERAHDAERELKRLRQERALFAAALQHDLRTPLTSILGCARTLRDRESDLVPTQRNDLLDIVVSQAQRLTEMISEALSRQAVGPDAPVSRLPLDLEALVQRVAAAAGAGRGGEVLVEVQPERIVTDAARLERALLNLVDNALKYAPPGTAVHVSGQRGSGTYRISVSDAGPGVAAEMVSTLFTPYATDPARSGGTGLGLHSASGLVAELGGRLTHSRRDGWTCFSIVLPQEGARSAPAEAAARRTG